MNKKDKHWWTKHYYCTTLCEKEDFHRARIYRYLSSERYDIFSVVYE